MCSLIIHVLVNLSKNRHGDSKNNQDKKMAAKSKNHRHVTRTEAHEAHTLQSEAQARYLGHILPRNFDNKLMMVIKLVILLGGL